MKDRFYRRWLVFLVVFLAFVAVLYLLADRIETRVDLTDNRIHTISDETRQILRGLKDIVTIQYYVSEKMPSDYHNLPRDTIERLRDYERISGGKIHVEIIDPDRIVSDYVQEKEGDKKEGKTEEEEITQFNPFMGGGGKKSARDEKLLELQSMGVPQLRGQVVKDDRFEIVPFFSSILIKYLEKPAEAIQVHSSLESMEYEIANRIIKLTAEKKPKFAFMLGKPSDVEDVPNPYAPGLPPTKMHPYEPLLDQGFGEKFEVEQIELTEKSPIPSGVELLMIAEPDALNDRQVFEIDRFLGNGGSLFLLMSRATSGLAKGDLRISPLSPRLEKLLDAWGVRQGQDLACSMICGPVVQRRRASNLPFEINQTVPVPAIPMALAPQLAQASPLTQGLQALIFPFASPLYADRGKMEASALKLTVLAKSDEKTWLRPWAPQLNEEMLDPPSDLRGEPIFTGSVDLAYLLEGVLPSAFKAGDAIPAWPKPAEKEKQKDEDAGSDGDKDDESKPGEAQASPSDGEAPGVFEPSERKPGRVIICASADMAKVHYLQIQEYQTNIPFFLNAIESIALGRGLVNIRAKTQTARPIEKLSRIEKNCITYGCILGVPLTFVLFGVLRHLLRRASSARYEREYLARARERSAAK